MRHQQQQQQQQQQQGMSMDWQAPAKQHHHLLGCIDSSLEPGML
jgi:hypothetical protein